MTKVLILGATGMLGHKLMQKLSNDFEVVGTVRPDAASFDGHPVLGGMHLIGGVTMDTFDTVTRAVGDARPDVIINAIGLIKQLPGAKDPIPSIMINSLLPHRLAHLARAAGARFFHMSTDCVFSGRTGGYTEEIEPDCLDLYGRSKLLGEVTLPGTVTLRTSIVGRELSSASGLFEWFISQRGGRVSGFAKAIYTGLTTAALADVFSSLIADHPDLEGLWQVSGEPISKYELLVMLNEALGLSIEIDRDDSFECDRSLDSSAFRSRADWSPPAWEDMIAELAADPTAYDSMRKAT